MHKKIPHTGDKASLYNNIIWQFIAALNCFTYIGGNTQNTVMINTIQLFPRQLDTSEQTSRGATAK